MSILEVELRQDTKERLQHIAVRRGVPEAELVRDAVENLINEEELTAKPKRSIMDLHGLGAEIWKDENGILIDAQEYVNGLRSEWDHRP